jgi:integrase
MTPTTKTTKTPAIAKKRNRKGTGSITRQKGRSIWHLRYRDSAGNLQSVSSETSDYTAAARMLAALVGGVANGEPAPSKDAASYTIDAAGEALVNLRRRAGKDVAAITIARHTRKYLRDYFGGDRRIDAIDSDAIAAYVAHRQDADEQPSPAEINRETSTLRSMFQHGIDTLKLRAMPKFPTKLDESGNVRQGFFERDEFEQVRANLLADKQAPDGIAAFVEALDYAYVSGWRFVNEILTIGWQQVDRGGQTVRLYTSKNGDGRVLAYGAHRTLVEVVETQHRRAQAFEKRPAHVFTDSTGEPLYKVTKGAQYLRSDLRAAWKRACKAAGVPGRILHDCRRTAVRNLVRAGISEGVCMQFTGHRSREVFERYNIINEADMSNAMARLAASQGQAMPPARPHAVA